jgi:hypothetical protein
MKTALILSAALLSTTALVGTAQAQDVQIENAVARVIVLVEDRSDVAVEIERGRADLPVPTVRRRGDRLEVNGNLPRRAIRNCRSGPDGARQPGEGASVDVRDVGRVNLADAPLIVVRTPRSVNVSASGAVFGTIGRGATDVDFGNGGCGDWTIANVDGGLDLSMGGSGDALVGTSDRLEIAIGGSGSVRAGATRDLEVSIGGSGDVEVAAVNGPVELAVGGSGELLVRGGTAPRMDISIAGSGDVEFRGTVGDLDVAVAGSGDVRVYEVTGRVSRAVLGSGDISIGR